MRCCASPGRVPGILLLSVKNPSLKFTPSAPEAGRFSWYVFQLKPAATSWSAMVLPEMLVAAGIDITPSMLFSPALLPAAHCTSLVQSTAGVSASVPSPVIGQMLGLDGLSVLTDAEARFGVQVALCQSGLLSLCTPKLEPPAISR